MSDFIKRMNQADWLASAFQRAELSALELEERLLGLGFYDVGFEPTRAAFNGVVWRLGTAQVEEVAA